MSGAESKAGTVGTWVVPFIVLLASMAVTYITYRTQKAGWDELVQAIKSQSALGNADTAVLVNLSKGDRDLLVDIIDATGQAARATQDMIAEINILNNHLRRQSEDTFVLKRIPREGSVTSAER